MDSRCSRGSRRGKGVLFWKPPQPEKNQIEIIDEHRQCCIRSQLSQVKAFALHVEILGPVAPYSFA